MTLVLTFKPSPHCPQGEVCEYPNVTCFELIPGIFDSWFYFSASDYVWSFTTAAVEKAVMR